jgi:nitroreductase
MLPDRSGTRHDRTMELQEVVRRRRMVRRYAARPVATDLVDRLLDNAVRAPSAGFSQGWAFLVLDRPQDVERFWVATTPPDRDGSPSGWLRGMRTAPVVIVPLASEQAYRDRYAQPDKGRGPAAEQAWPVPYWYVDTGMATLMILLTAVDEGLGGCFFGVPPAQVQALRTEFGIPADQLPVGAITLGYPAPDERAGGSATRRPRRSAAEVVHRGGWTGPADPPVRPTGQT